MYIIKSVSLSGIELWGSTVLPTLFPTYKGFLTNVQNQCKGWKNYFLIIDAEDVGHVQT